MIALQNVCIFLAVPTICLGCAALSPAKYQEDALALAYSACVKDADVKKAAEQAGTTSEQLCALVMNAVVKQLQEQQKKAEQGADAGCAGGSCPMP